MSRGIVDSDASTKFGLQITNLHVLNELCHEIQCMYIATP